MAANSSTGVKTNYYSISYGYLASGSKELPEGKEAITSEVLKSSFTKFDLPNLNNRYRVKENSEYPYIEYFGSITGYITDINVTEVKGMGKFLNITLIDKDNEVSKISTSLYKKYSADFLNRLCGVDFNGKVFTFSPYAIKSVFVTSEGQSIQYYNQGVAIVDDQGNKHKRKYQRDENGNLPKELPAPERVMDSNGNEVTSLVKQVNFLLKEVMDKLDPVVPQQKTTPSVEKAASNVQSSYTPPPQTDFSVDEEDDLPF